MGGGTRVRQVLGGVAVLGCVACGGPGDETVAGVVSVDFTADELVETIRLGSEAGLPEDERFVEGEPCMVTPRVLRRAGDRLTVRDGDGNTIATASLGQPGVLSGAGCAYEFSATVPSTAFYEFELSGAPDHPVTFSREELESSDWDVTVALGSGN